MTNTKKIILGIISFLPLLLMAFYLYNIISFFWHFLKEAGHYESPDEFMFSDFTQMAGLIVSAILLGIISLGVMVYFMIHVINNTAINRDERIVWILVFIFVGMVTFPVYWYMRIWKQREPPLPG